MDLCHVKGCSHPVPRLEIEGWGGAPPLKGQQCTLCSKTLCFDHQFALCSKVFCPSCATAGGVSLCLVGLASLTLGSSL